MKFVIATWLAGGRLADVVLAATALELVGLVAWHVRTRRGLSWQPAASPACFSPWLYVYH